jgi:hypothetical protein
MISGALCSACSPGCAVPSSWTSTPWVSARVDRDRDRGRDAVYPVHQALGRAPRAPVPPSVDPGKERGHTRVHAGIDSRSAPGTGHPEPRATGAERTSRQSFTGYGYAITRWPPGRTGWCPDGARRPEDPAPGDPTFAAGLDATPTPWGGPTHGVVRTSVFLGKKDSAAIGSPGKPRTSRALFHDPRCRRRAMPGASSATHLPAARRTAYDPDLPVADLLRSLTAAYGDAAPAVARYARSGIPDPAPDHRRSRPSTACNVYCPRSRRRCH